MNTVWVVLVYGSSLVLALALLYRFHARWYWHVLSIVLAFVVGLIHFPPEWKLPDLLIGSVFFFLFFWGIGAPFFRRRRGPTTAARHA